MPYSLRSIAKGSILFTFGQMLTKASVFFLIPVYTRFLTPDDYGVLGYLQFILQILATILMFGLYGAQTRFFYEYKGDSKKIGEFLCSINIWLIVVLASIGLLFYVFGQYVYNLFGPKDIPFNPYLPVILWTSIFQILNQLSISYWVARKEYLKTTMLQIVQFLLITSITIYFVVVLQTGAIGYFKGMLYGQILFFITTYPAYFKKFNYQFRWQYIVYSLSFGVPIVIHLLSGIIHTSVDRAILAEMVPLNELGIYTLGYQVGMIMYLVTISVNSAWQPSYYDLMESKDKDKGYQLIRTYNVWIIIISLVCIVGILWAGDILVLITPAQFNGAARIVPLVFLGYFFHGLYLFFVSPVFFYKKTKLLFLFTGSAAIVNIALNFLFIPFWGIAGSALATTFSMLFQSVAVYMYSKKLINYKINLTPTATISLILGLSIIASLYFRTAPLSILMKSGFTFVTIASVYGFHRQDLKIFLARFGINAHKQ